MNKQDIVSLDQERLTEALKAAGEQSFRGRQVYEWLHRKAASDFQEMTNLSADLRKKLSEWFTIPEVRPVGRLVSQDGQTTKYLFALSDGKVIESVLMKYKHGSSVCISSQAGCRMGCKFCASAIGGLERNLEISEMLGQVYRIGRLSGERVSNVVVMGTGEPLDNFDHLTGMIRMLSDENGLNISQRNITVSTCGIIPKLRALAELDFQITLAVSLHAPDDETRQKLMPVANKYRMDELMDACRYYFMRTGRRLTFEYSLIQGINDSDRMAASLSRLLRGMNCHVNLIPVNPVKEYDFKHSDGGRIQKFKNILEKNRINVTIRREMGTDINAACGQLRKSYLDHTEHHLG